MAEAASLLHFPKNIPLSAYFVIFGDNVTIHVGGFSIVQVYAHVVLDAAYLAVLTSPNSGHLAVITSPNSGHLAVLTSPNRGHLDKILPFFFINYNTLAGHKQLVIHNHYYYINEKQGKIGLPSLTKNIKGNTATLKSKITGYT